MVNKKEPRKIYRFLCDRKKECSRSLGCGKNCRHTSDPNHMKNNPPGKMLRDWRNPVLWWEIDYDEPTEPLEVKLDE